MPEARSHRRRTVHRLQRHSEYAESAQHIFLQPFAFSIDQSQSLSAQTLRIRNVLCSEKGGTEAEMHISENKGLKEKQENLILGKQKGASSEGSQLWAREQVSRQRGNLSRKLICRQGHAAPWHRAAAAPAASICGTCPAVLSSTAQLLTYVGNREQTCHSAEHFHVLLPQAAEEP